MQLIKGGAASRASGARGGRATRGGGLPPPEPPAFFFFVFLLLGFEGLGAEFSYPAFSYRVLWVYVVLFERLTELLFLF